MVVRSNVCAFGKGGAVISGICICLCEIYFLLLSNSKMKVCLWL